MRINALPSYNPSYTNMKYQNQIRKDNTNFTGMPKISQSIKNEAETLGAIACVLGVPFLMCLALKRILGLDKQDSSDYIFLNDGTYFAHVDDFKEKYWLFFY